MDEAIHASMILQAQTLAKSEASRGASQAELAADAAEDGATAAEAAEVDVTTPHMATATTPPKPLSKPANPSGEAEVEQRPHDQAYGSPARTKVVAKASASPEGCESALGTPFQDLGGIGGIGGIGAGVSGVVDTPATLGFGGRVRAAPAAAALFGDSPLGGKGFGSAPRGLVSMPRGLVSTPRSGADHYASLKPLPLAMTLQSGEGVDESAGGERISKRRLARMVASLATTAAAVSSLSSRMSASSRSDDGDSDAEIEHHEHHEHHEREGDEGEREGDDGDSDAEIEHHSDEGDERDEREGDERDEREGDERNERNEARESESLAPPLLVPRFSLSLSVSQLADVGFGFEPRIFVRVNPYSGKLSFQAAAASKVMLLCSCDGGVTRALLRQCGPAVFKQQPRGQPRFDGDELLLPVSTVEGEEPVALQHELPAGAAVTSVELFIVPGADDDEDIRNGKAQPFVYAVIAFSSPRLGASRFSKATSTLRTLKPFNINVAADEEACGSLLVDYVKDRMGQQAFHKVFATLRKEDGTIDIDLSDRGGVADIITPKGLAAVWSDIPDNADLAREPFRMPMAWALVARAERHAVRLAMAGHFFLNNNNTAADEHGHGLDQGHGHGPSRVRRPPPNTLRQAVTDGAKPRSPSAAAAPMPAKRKRGGRSIVVEKRSIELVATVCPQLKSRGCTAAAAC